jgi:crotonobetainyl-CoA:carnitine CoA-transferase CaiB-like acyl-CoA transferase
MDMPGVLEGVRIIDLTSGIAGPMATMVMSDHGAEVVKVERPGGDPMRSYEGFRVWNRGKASVVADLDRPDDRDRVRRLAATADVLIESFAPGKMAAWGLDYESLKDELPGLIYLSITPYGRTTASAGRPGHDLLVQARSGQQYEQPGWRDGPIFLYAPLPSMATSYLALEGVAAALFAREVTGRGQWVETSLYQGVLLFTTQLWQDAERRPPEWYALGRDPQPGIYECADGLWVHSMHNAGGRGKDRSALWGILGIEPMDMSRTAAGAAAQDAVLRPAFKKIPRQHLLEAFWENGFAVAPIRRAEEALEDPQVLNNGMAVKIDDPGIGPMTQAGISFRLHGAPTPVPQGPQAEVGQHTEETWSGLSGLDPRARRVGPAKRPLAHALEGIKVLDIGNFLAGPFGPMLLGDLGAKVYKLESPEGDQMRPITMPFNGCQRGKFDVCADLKTPEGLEIAHRLIRSVDVVHHNMRPGVAERLGVDYATAKRLNPKIIYCHTTMWGSDGPRSTWPGFDQLGQSSCGLEYELSGEGNPPVWYRFGMCDQACACQSLVAVLLALYWREKTGEGQLVDTSIVNGGVYLNSDVWAGPDGPFVRPRLDHEQTGIGPLYRLYRTSDGWIAIAVLTERDWERLVEVVPALAGLSKVALADARDDPSLAALLETAFAGGTSAAWFGALDGAGVPAEIADPEATTSWFDAPDLVAAGLVADYEHPEYGRFRQVGHVVHLSETPGKIWGPPPRLGEHSREVLDEIGYSGVEILRLRELGVTTWPGA